jgi:hypothetical protein
LPIALGLGAAAKSRIPMGIVIIGGLLFSLVLTLYVVPGLYSYLSRDKNGPTLLQSIILRSCALFGIGPPQWVIEQVRKRQQRGGGTTISSRGADQIPAHE